MNQNLPTLKQLQYFVMLADHLHFGDAAATLGVSQPNLSSQIRELEKTLGVTLIERTSRSVMLTQVGQSILERATEILSNINDLVSIATNDHNPLDGRMKLGVIPTLAPYILPSVLPSVRAKWPDLELQLFEDFTESLIRRLSGGEIDLALIARVPGLDGFNLHHIVDEPFVIVAPSSHRISKAKKVTSGFSNDDFLLLHEGNCLRDQAIDICNLQSKASSKVIEAASLSTLVQMVANGFGLTLLPASAIPIDVPRGKELKSIPFAKPYPTREIVLVWRSSSPWHESYVEFAEFLKTKVEVLIHSITKKLHA